MASEQQGTPVSPSFDGQELLDGLSCLRAKIGIEVESPYILPSAHLTLRHLSDLSHKVNEVTSANRHVGIVITTGTDTLEEVAYFLNLTYRNINPVIVTGAMRNPSQVGSDGARNILDSIRCAVSTECSDSGVLVVMNGEIHGADDVTKTHTSDVSAFQSPRAGALGCVQEDRVIMFRRLWGREFIELAQCDESIELIRCVVGDSGRGMQLLMETGAGGFVIEAFGGGHVTPAMRDVIHSVTQKGIPVIVTSRCLSGRTLRSTYNYQGSEIDLQSLGVYFSNGLSGPKSRIKLSLLLGNALTKHRISDYFSSQ